MNVRGKLLCAPALTILITVAPLHSQNVQPNRSVTFTKDVLPIFHRSCVQCHQPGTPAPMSLLTYEDAYPWNVSIKLRVQNRQMPPWHIDRSVGEYDPDPSLSDDEIATIVAWVDAGAPRGKPEDAPPPPELHPLDAWTFGEPDLIVTSDEFVVSAEGPDMYPLITVETGLTEDRYIKWIQTIPGDPRVVHHLFVDVIQDDPEFQDQLVGGEAETVLDLYGIGSAGDIYPPGTGKLLKAGSKIRFGGHYHSVGEEVRDRTRVGFGLYPKGEEPEHRAVALALRASVPTETGPLIELSIPKHEDNVRHDRYFHLARPTKIINFMPHMHYLGKRMQLEAIFRDGHRKLLTDATDYDVRWQITYTYKDPPILPAGTFLHVISYHDNSANNPNNPDPSSWIGRGNRTVDEMASGWTTITYISDEEFEAYVQQQRKQGKRHIHR